MPATHGMSGTKFYVVWTGMKRRTTDKKYHAYDRYGGRGIKVCERWGKFENFYEDMYESFLIHVEKYGKKNTSIDRVNNDGDYFPANCRWSTKLEQSRNQGNVLFVNYLGMKTELASLARRFGVGKKTLKYRIFTMKMTPEEAVVTKRCNSNVAANEARWGKAGVTKFNYNGEDLSVLELSKISNIKYSTLKSRLFMYGWDVKKAMETPVKM